MRGLSPNQPLTDFENPAAVGAPDVTPEDDMTLTQTTTLDPDNGFSTRIDCNCNAYSRETVTIPWAVMHEALITAGDDEHPNEIAARVMADDRVYSIRTATGAERVRPTAADFKRKHVFDAASTMRNRGLAPWQPLASNRAHLKDRPIWLEYLQRVMAEVDLTETAAQAAEAEISERAPAVAEMTIGDPADPDFVQDGTIDGLTGTASPASDADMAELTEADPYPEGVGANKVNAWVGDDQARARVALDRELARDGGPRVTVTRYLARMGVE